MAYSYLRKAVSPVVQDPCAAKQVCLETSMSLRTIGIGVPSWKSTVKHSKEIGPSLSFFEKDDTPLTSLNKHMAARKSTFENAGWTSKIHSLA